MSNVSRKDLEENCSDMTVEILNLSGKLRVADIRISELEAKNMDAAVAHGKLLKRISELKNDNNELERLREQWKQSSDEKEAKLAAVEKLPEKWMQRAVDRDWDSAESCAWNNAADELESALKQEDSPTSSESPQTQSQHQSDTPQTSSPE